MATRTLKRMLYLKAIPTQISRRSILPPKYPYNVNRTLLVDYFSGLPPEYSPHKYPSTQVSDAISVPPNYRSAKIASTEISSQPNISHRVVGSRRVNTAKKQKIIQNEDDEVYLRIEGKLFMTSKELLSSNSEYFRAMFSGNYREAQEHVIEIEIVDTSSMKQILNFMKTSKVELKELQEASRLLSAATYLQMDKLVTHIEDHLMNGINAGTWLDIMDVADAANALRLLQRAAAFGLYNVREVSEQMEHFRSFEKLQWYLSHTHLIPENEQQVFEMGTNWIEKHEDAHPDSVLVVVGSLNISNLTYEELSWMKCQPATKKCKRASDILDCLHLSSWLSDDEYGIVNMKTFTENKVNILTNFAREIYDDVKRLIEGSVRREEVSVPCIAASQVSDVMRRCEPDHLYSYSGMELGPEKLVQAASGSLWGWAWAPWGTHRAVVVGGEYARGSGRFEKSVRVYDTLSGVWSDHGVSLPPCRHAGTAVLGNTLYMVGGVGKYRIVKSSVIAYDLIDKTYREIPDLPEQIQCPAIVTHKGNLLVAGQFGVYMLRDKWDVMIKLSMRVDLLVSMRGRLYTAHGDPTILARLRARTECTTHNNDIKYYKNSVSAFCYAGGRLTAFMVDQLEEKVYVECSSGSVWSGSNSSLSFCGAAGCGPLALRLPPVQPTQQATFALQCLQDMRQS